MGHPSPRYSAEFKQQVVRLYRERGGTYAETARELGVDPDFHFEVINSTVAAAFYDNGQAMLNSAVLLPELIENGVRVMAYAGDTGGSIIDVSCAWRVASDDRWCSL